MEYVLRAEVSLVKAFKADTRGNLIFRGGRLKMPILIVLLWESCIGEIQIGLLFGRKSLLLNDDSMFHSTGRGRNDRESRQIVHFC